MSLHLPAKPSYVPTEVTHETKASWLESRPCVHHEELPNLNSSPNITGIRKSRKMGRECSIHGENKNTYRILMIEPEGKRPLRKPRCGWKDNIKMDLRDIA
jgi:hypothetical protein